MVKVKSAHVVKMLEILVRQFHSSQFSSDFNSLMLCLLDTDTYTAALHSASKQLFIITGALSGDIISSLLSKVHRALVDQWCTRWTADREVAGSTLTRGHKVQK